MNTSTAFSKTSATHDVSLKKEDIARKLEQVQAGYTSLYRKYRPSGWGEVIGQQHIVDILKYEAEKSQPNHAYLFAGSRGTGKTTIARIFARTIGTSSEDTYEIDAASNTSVDDVRRLTESIHTLPLNSSFKVYILDEVHMLSKSAFNAFLKTLEEPPRHVIFILATTELHKIPETIVSRCQVFQFKKPSIEILQTVIIDLGKKEGKIIEIEAAEKIAKLGNGSFRDTISHLQGIFTLFDAVAPGLPISRNLIETHLSTPSSSFVDEFIHVLLDTDEIDTQKKIITLFEILQQVNQSSMNVELFVDLIIEHIRINMLKYIQSGQGKWQTDGQKINTKTNESVSLISHDIVNQKKSLTSLDPVSQCIKAIELLLEQKSFIGKTSTEILPIELAVIKFFNSI